MAAKGKWSMSPAITGISSMATRQILGELCHRYQDKTGIAVAIEPMGGVDAARRIRGGEATDVIVLASGVMAKLEAEGFVAAGSVVDVARSGMAIAVRAGAAHPDIGDEAAVKRAVAAAARIGYSTGPSGDHLLKLCARWGVPASEDRIVKAPPGVPVGSLVAEGKADLGFQQLSELLHVPGLEVVGPLPPEIQAETVFSAGICAASSQPQETRQLIAFLAAPESAEVKRAQGMEPA